MANLLKDQHGVECSSFGCIPIIMLRTVEFKDIEGKEIMLISAESRIRQKLATTIRDVCMLKKYGTEEGLKPLFRCFCINRRQASTALVQDLVSNTNDKYNEHIRYYKI